MMMGSEFSYKRCAETEYTEHSLPGSTASITHESFSNLAITPPLVDSLVHTGPHSISLATCQATPGSTPFINGTAAIIAVSVDLPHKTISAPSLRTLIKGSTPASATIFEQERISCLSTTGAPSSA